MLLFLVCFRYICGTWTCIFDNSLDVDKWAAALQYAGINTLEYHPWMRAHEEVAPETETWNTYVGDDRLWTSKAMMKQKVETEISRKMDESMQQMTNRVYRRIEEKLKTERERRGRI